MEGNRKTGTGNLGAETAGGWGGQGEKEGARAGGSCQGHGAELMRSLTSRGAGRCCHGNHRWGDIFEKEEPTSLEILLAVHLLQEEEWGAWEC